MKNTILVQYLTSFLFLLQPLARLGATVTGIDAGNENIEAAKHHASFDPSIRNNIEYRYG